MRTGQVERLSIPDSAENRHTRNHDDVHDTGGDRRICLLGLI